MTRLLSVIVFVAFLSGCLSKDEDFDVFAESYDTVSWAAENIKTLEITVVNGNLIVNGHDRPVIDAVIYKRAWGLNFEDAENHLSDIEIKKSETADKILINVDIPDVNRKYISSLSMNAPGILDLDFFGIIGDFTAENITGDINFVLSNGLIETDLIRGDLSLQLDKGSIEIYNHAGSIEADINNGGVYCSLLDLASDNSIEIESGYGGVLIELSPDASFSFDIATSTGKLNIEGFDSVNYNLNQLYHRTGIVNGGNASIEVLCGTGSITIQGRE